MSEHSNSSHEFRSSGLMCEPGIIIPVWLPLDNVEKGEIAGRAIFYLVCLAYIFFGLEVLCDKFMGSIEMITSTKKVVAVKNQNGTETVVVRVWNETVANLTLMALGCSAPEILLSSIEIIGKNFEAGELGPGSTLGSAAFNMFFIIGVCVFVVPSNEHRTIKHVNVFIVTALWSVFAYFWMYFILALSSYGEIELWEAIVTFLFFPATVMSAYIADRYFVIHDFLKKRYRTGRNAGMLVQTEAKDDFEPEKGFDNTIQDEDFREFEEYRKTYLCIICNLRKKYPHIDLPSLEIMACKELLDCGSKSKAFLRNQATRKLAGRASFVKKVREMSQADLHKVFKTQNSGQIYQGDDGIKVHFEVGHYSVMENIGDFEIVVVCDGAPKDCTILVDFKTLDGTATSGMDYATKTGTLVFSNGETKKNVVVKIIDDDIFEEDKYFHVRLENVRLLSFECDPLPLSVKRLSIIPESEGHANDGFEADEDHGIVMRKLGNRPDLLAQSSVPASKFKQRTGRRDSISVPTTPIMSHKVTFSPPPKLRTVSSELQLAEKLNVSLMKVLSSSVQLTSPFIATVLILDDDHSGIFSLTTSEETLSESSGGYEVKIVRCGGAKNRVVVPYHIEEGTAEPGVDYDDVSGELVFEEGESTKSVPVLIKSTGSYQKDVLFYFVLGDPYRQEREGFFRVRSTPLLQRQKLTKLGGQPVLGEIRKLQIRIRESKEFKNRVDALIRKTNRSIKNGVSLWFDQFTSAFSLRTKEDEEEDSKLTAKGVAGRLLRMPWNLMTALIPPEEMAGGYPCFFISIAFVGFLTTLIGDISSHFGCTIGLKDSVTAICLVSLGTSFPELLASKIAAVQNTYADASVSNVTGGNAVNVFLGIGTAWLIGACYHTYRGEPFKVDPGNLAFAVTLYCILAFVGISLLMIRRLPFFGGEFGGKMALKLPTFIAFTALWLFYLTMAVLEAQGYISGF